MKSTLSTLILALTTLTALTTSTAQAAAFDGWTLNGNAQRIEAGNMLRLAEGNYQAGSAWAPDKVSLAHDFSVAFSFQIAGGSGADGLTFTIHDNVAGGGALGSNGGDLGYRGLNKSVAFIYDTWENNVDTDRVPGPNTAATFGGEFNVWGGATVGHAYELRDKVLYSWVDYSAATNTFSMYLSDTGIKPLSARETLDGTLADLGGSAFAYVGFTGATGGANDMHDILSVSISAVPEANTTLLALAGGPFALGLLRRKKRAVTG